MPDVGKVSLGHWDDVPTFASAEYKGHADEKGVKKVLKSDLQGMFDRCMPDPLDSSERALSTPSCLRAGHCIFIYHKRHCLRAQHGLLQN